ncbi:MAG: hypothetical protein HFH82_10315 [Lachnospiraceae bacterium]|nr:hypothetical protein [Lachnospiraceae bacterium]
MLGKLIKHEWKSTYKVGCLLLFAVVLITFMGWLAFQSPMWHNGGYRVTILDILSIVTIIMYVLLLIGVVYGVMIYVAVHFYRTMYTDQGYLIHTLPVTKHQILCSKILVSGLWMLFIGIGMTISVMMLFSSLIAAVMPAGYTLPEAWGEIWGTFGELSEFILYEFDLDILRSFVVLLICMLISPFTTVTILFGAISAGQFFTKVRVLMAIVCYIGILIVNNIFSSIAQNILILQASFGNYMDISTILNTIINIMIAVGLYVVSWLVISKKLNMQ